MTMAPFEVTGTSGDNNGAKPPNGQHVSNADKQRQHQKVVRFFDEGGWNGMSINQVAGALNVSTDSVRAEARRRGAYQPRGPLSEHRRVSAALPVPKLPPGAVEKEIDKFFAKYPGGMFTVNEIAELTGMKVASIRTVLSLRGLTAEREEGQSRNEFGKYRIPGETPDEGSEQLGFISEQARQPESHVTPAETEDNGLGITYAGRTAEGRLVASVKGSDILWTLKLDRPL